MLHPEGRGARSRALWLLAPLLLAGAVAAQAGTTALTVSATVVSKGNCRFQTAAPTLDFGTINPASTTTVTASTTIQVRCTGAGSNPTITYNLQAGDGRYLLGGMRRMRHATDTTEFMPYSVSLSPAAATIAKNTTQSITISGTVVPADYQNVRVGTYSDTVVLTLDP